VAESTEADIDEPGFIEVDLEHQMIEWRTEPDRGVYPGGVQGDVVAESGEQEGETAVELVTEAPAAPVHDLVDEGCLFQRERLAQVNAEVLERNRPQMPELEIAQRVGVRPIRPLRPDSGEVGVNRGAIHLALTLSSDVSLTKLAVCPLLRHR